MIFQARGGGGVKPLLKNRLLAYFKKNPSLKILLKTPYIPLKNTLLQNLDFTLTHFDEISSWLNSKEFKETYADINHPYPPLLNPAKLNDENYPLSYEKIPANLAWEMNLPLPRRYKVVFFMFGASAQSVWHFFTKSFGLILFLSLIGGDSFIFRTFTPLSIKTPPFFHLCFVAIKSKILKEFILLHIYLF